MKKMKTICVIMAGGEGTRFWPLSRKKTPKQLLNLTGNNVMINETIERFSPFITKSNLFVVTNCEQAETINRITRGKILPSHILSEPISRNTAACIGYAAMKIKKEYGDAVMVVSPSDSYVKNNEKFIKIVDIAVKKASEEQNIVTIGIKPSFPSTGYGYIKYKKNNNSIKKVERFVEKPSLANATRFFESHSYYWNSGIFVWKASTILDKIREFLPDTYEKLCSIFDAFGTKNEKNILVASYKEIKPISIDYGVIEKCKEMFVIGGDFGWSDVGSWDMMKTLHSPDSHGNIILGDALLLETENSTIYSKSACVVTLGIKDLIVVQTPDAILICDKNQAQNVKRITNKLEQLNRKELL